MLKNLENSLVESRDKVEKIIDDYGTDFLPEDILGLAKEVYDEMTESIINVQRIRGAYNEKDT